MATVYPAEDESRAAPAPKHGCRSRTIRWRSSARSRPGPGSARSPAQKRDPLALFNSPEWRRTEFGGSSGHANARGLGRIMSALSLDGVSRGVKLLSPETIDLIFREQSAASTPTT